MSEELKDIEEVPEETEEVEVPEAVTEPEDQQKEQYRQNVERLRISKEENEVRAQENALRAQENEERARRAEYERDQMAQYIERIQPSKPQQQPLTNDDIIDGSHYNPLRKEVDQLQKDREKEHQWRVKQEESIAEMRLKSEHSDFDDVVTKARVSAYIKRHPEMESAIVNSGPIYNRGKAAYTLLKDFETKEKNLRQNNEIVQNNMNKPKPSVSLKTESKGSPLSQAASLSRDYSPERMAKLRKDMDDALANL